MKDYLRAMTIERASSIAMKETAMEHGFKPMFNNVMNKVGEVVTMIEEIMKLSEDAE